MNEKKKQVPRGRNVRLREGKRDGVLVTLERELGCVREISELAEEAISAGHHTQGGESNGDADGGKEGENFGPYIMLL